MTLHPSHRQPLPPIFPHTFRFSPTPFTTLHTSLRQPLPPTFPHTFRFTPTTFTTLHPSLQQALFNPTLSPVSSTSATPRPRLPCLHPHRHPRHVHTIISSALVPFLRSRSPSSPITLGKSVTLDSKGGVLLPVVRCFNPFTPPNIPAVPPVPQAAPAPTVAAPILRATEQPATTTSLFDVDILLVHGGLLPIRCYISPAPTLAATHHPAPPIAFHPSAAGHNATTTSLPTTDAFLSIFNEPR